MIKGLHLLLLIFPIMTYTQNFGLPEEFLWRYSINNTAPTSRMGQYWRDGILLEETIIVLNTHYLIGLNYAGEQLWAYELPAEYLFSTAKIHALNNNEILVVITDNILKINIHSGELIKNQPVPRNSQDSELQAQGSLLWQNNLYVFYGNELLTFDGENLTQEKLISAESPPKTKLIAYNNKIIAGLLNKKLIAIDPTNKTFEVIVDTGTDIRQPVIVQDNLYIPTSTTIFSYNKDGIFTQSDRYKDAILSPIANKLIARQHKKGIIQELDPITLESLQSFRYENEKNNINQILAGTDSYIIHTDSIKGYFIVLNYGNNGFSKKFEYYVEDFLDNPPLQILNQKNNHILLGAFDGLYLINVPQK